MEINTLDELIAYCKDKNRICPQPTLWNKLWEKLKNKKQVGSGWQPSLPLILAAWWDTPALFKQIRLIEHLNWADQQGQLNEIADYLTSLTEEQWFHLND